MSTHLPEFAETSTPTKLELPGWGTLAKSLTVLVILSVGCWILIGERTWQDISGLQAAEREAEDSAPIGYIGLYFRKHYAARPSKFIFEESGKKLLFASLAEEPDEPPSFYDVSEAGFDTSKLSGGAGRDSVAGVDYPILETRRGRVGRNFGPRHDMYTTVLSEGPRAYPCRILEKVHVVNDRNGIDPFVLVFQHASGLTLCYDSRVDGEAVTFGTTGYGIEGAVMLYDRATQSLWLPKATGLTCVNGQHLGKVLPRSHSLEKTTWGNWTSRFPESEVLVGNDRSLPIPAK